MYAGKYTKDNKRKNGGFSLIELIIAIAILVILTGFLAPNLIRHIEKSREGVCRKNMDELLNIYRIEYVSNNQYTISDVITDYQDREPCPSDGVYTDQTRRMGITWIMCSIHDAEALKKTPDVAAGDSVYNEMIQFAGKDAEKIRKEILETYFGTDSSKKWPSNDNLREYLYSKVYNGAWPSSTTLVNGKTMYIQPYINIKSNLNDTKEDSVVLFANGNGSIDTKNWNATLIYDSANSTWYKAPNNKDIGVANKNWSQIKAEMDSAGWIPVSTK